MNWPGDFVDRVICGDALETMGGIPAGVIQCCVCSPPYWGLRDYGLEPIVWGGDNGCKHEWQTEKGFDYSKKGNNGSTTESDPGHSTASRFNSQHSFCLYCNAWRGSLGLEPTPDLYVQHLVEIFREVRRVLKNDGTLWLNLGDSYVGSCRGADTKYANPQLSVDSLKVKPDWSITGLKPKDLCMIPARVALALQADGWWLRSVIIWHKPSCMPESVTDRPTTAHEYLYLLAKSESYYYDADAIREPTGNEANPEGYGGSFHDHSDDSRAGQSQKKLHNFKALTHPAGRNKRTVWTISPEPLRWFAYDFSSADYVDDHGIPRKWSPDCPKHEQDGRPRRESPEAVSCDEPTGPESPDNERIDDCPSQAQPLVVDSISRCKTNQPSDSPSLQNENSTSENRIHVDEPDVVVEKTPFGTTDIQSEHDPSKMDSLSHAYSETATSHNRNDCKSDHDGQTYLHDTACEESENHRSNSGQQLSLNVPEPNIFGNNNIPCSVHQKSKAQNHNHNSYIYSYNKDKCKCSISQVSHFASFPIKLVEPCIMAGTSEKGNCGKCGKPWIRVVEKKPSTMNIRVRDNVKGIIHEKSGVGGKYKASAIEIEDYGKEDMGHSRTIGWQASCSCNAESVPPIVLDPFSGSGTVGVVAKRLQRRYILSDLNAKYNKIAEDRLRQKELF